MLGDTAWPHNCVFLLGFWISCWDVIALSAVAWHFPVASMTSPNGNTFRVTGHLWSPVNSPHKGQWRCALMFSLICTLNKRFSKQSWGWRFETPSRSLWRHYNALLSRQRAEGMCFIRRSLISCHPILLIILGISWHMMVWSVGHCVARGQRP